MRAILACLKPNTAAGYIIKAQVFMSEGETCHDLWCVSPSAPECKPLVLPWTVWLGASIPGSVKRKYSPAEMVAHCLRGMTRLGFTRAHIRRTLNALWEDLMRQHLQAEAEGYQSTSLDAFLGEDPAPDSDAKEPQTVITPRFQESLSRVPHDQHRKIKTAIKRLRRRKVR